MSKKIRLQEYGVGIFEALQTKSALKKAIKREAILIDGQIAKTSNWIEEGQLIELKASVSDRPKKIFNLKLQVIYEDDTLAVVEKPSGYPTNGNYFKTIENALPANLKVSSNADRLPYPQPVHRLDNPTSGLLLVAKTSSSKSLLSSAFEHHKVQKTYTAIAHGRFEETSGVYETAIHQKESKTSYKVVQNLKRNGNNFTLVELAPSTGRTHQIRIHLSESGHPILGDSAYGTENDTLNKLCLHASGLKFSHPKTKEEMCFESPIPKRFLKFIKPKKQ